MWDEGFQNVRICHGDKRAGNWTIQSGLNFWRKLNATFTACRPISRWRSEMTEQNQNLSSNLITK